MLNRDLSLESWKSLLSYHFYVCMSISFSILTKRVDYPFRKWTPKTLNFPKKGRLPIRNFFENPHFLKVEVGFFSDKKSFSQIFQICAHLYHLNFIWKKFEQNPRTFLGPITHHPSPITTHHPSPPVRHNYIIKHANTPHPPPSNTQSKRRVPE